MITIEAFVHLGLQGCTIKDTLEIGEEELEGLSGTEREEAIAEIVRDWAYQYIDYGWKELS